MKRITLTILAIALATTLTGGRMKTSLSYVNLRGGSDSKTETIGINIIDGQEYYVKKTTKEFYYLSVKN